MIDNVTEAKNAVFGEVEPRMRSDPLNPRFEFIVAGFRRCPTISMASEKCREIWEFPCGNIGFDEFEIDFVQFKKQQLSQLECLPIGHVGPLGEERKGLNEYRVLSVASRIIELTRPKTIEHRLDGASHD
jgi:hypothetical protein